MNLEDLQKKNWLIPFVRTVYSRFDFTSFGYEASLAETFSQVDFVLWKQEALQKRGFLSGAQITRWPVPPEGITSQNRGNYLFFNLLCHQLELLIELQFKYQPGGEQVQAQLTLLSILARHHSCFDEADLLKKLRKEDWGGPEDPQRQKLAYELGPVVRYMGQQLKEAYLHTYDHPMLDLPFYHVLAYADTRQLLSLAQLEFQSKLKISPSEVEFIQERGNKEKVNLLKGIIALAQADGIITRVEKRLVQNILEMARLPKEESQEVWSYLKTPISPEEVGVGITDPMTKRFLLEQLLLHSHLEENGPNSDEAAFIQRFGSALGLESEEILHCQTEAFAYLEKHPGIVQAFSLGGVFQRYKNYISDKIQSMLKDNIAKIKKEMDQTKELLHLLKKRRVQELSEEEEDKVREQMLDIFRSIPALTLFSMPGGTFLFPLALKYLPPQLLPSAFVEKDEVL